MLRCELCNLIVDEAVWCEGAPERLEERHFGDGYEPARSEWVRLFESANNRRTMRRIRRHGATSGSLLEVGVGSGSFLSHARREGFAPAGCDLSSAICRRVAQNTGVAVHCGSLDSFPASLRFDVIVMNHVLEHVADPRSLLSSALSRLKPDGILHLAVPNAAAWEAHLPGWTSYEPYHLLYFTSATLGAAVADTGFEVLEVDTHESFSGWFLALLRTLLRRDRRLAKHSALASSARAPALIVEHSYRLAMVISGVFAFPLRRMQQWLGRGDELVLLARNPSDVR